MAYLVIMLALFFLKTVVSSDWNANTEEIINKPDDSLKEISMDTVLQRLQILEQRDTQHRTALDEMKTVIMDSEAREIEHEHEMQRLTERIVKVELENERLTKVNAMFGEKLGVDKAREAVPGRVVREGIGLYHTAAVPGRVVREGKGLYHTAAVPGRVVREDLLRRSSSQPVVAFYAQAVSKLSHLGPNQPLRFDHVVTNIGNGYNPHVGDFTAPVDGIYVFQATIMSAGINNSYVGFVLNGNVISTLLLKEHPHDNTGQQIIIEMRQSDDISIRNVIYDRSYEGGHQTSFSGFLLSETGHGVNTIVG